MPGPSDDHLLGLDAFGSDLFTQLVYGARQSLVIGVVSTLIGLRVGTAARPAGRRRSAAGSTSPLMRCVDILLSIP